MIVKWLHSSHKNTFYLRIQKSNYCTYGYLTANNRQLTSFATARRRRSFVQHVCAGTKSLHTTSLERTVRNEYKYQLISR